MTKKIYNIFLFFDNEICSTAGYCVHEYEGTDDEAIDFLKAQLSEDLNHSVRLELTQSFSRSEYNSRCRLGEGHLLYDELFSAVCACSEPLFISTPVKDGEIFYHYSSKHGLFDINDAAASVGEKGVMTDWLVKYTNETGIDLPRLIHDDYFIAIKLTFNARLYVSAMKLLVSCIDSVAYIEYGDMQGMFIRWLEDYADLAPLGISAPELWELRNGILHMSNLSSKKVRQSKVRRISFRVGGPSDSLGEPNEIYYFDFYTLIQAFAEALGRWIETYNIDRNKFVTFVERYDETISDSRAAVIRIGQQGLA